MAATSSAAAANAPGASRARLLLAPDGAIIRCGDEWATVTGYRSGETIGRLVSMLYDAGTSEMTLRQIMALMADGTHFTVRVPCRTKDATAFVGDFSFVVAKSLPSGESAFLCTLTRDGPGPSISSESDASPEQPPQSDPTAASANLPRAFADAMAEAEMAQVSRRCHRTPAQHTVALLPALPTCILPFPSRPATHARRPSSSRTLRTR